MKMKQFISFAAVALVACGADAGTNFFRSARAWAGGQSFVWKEYMDGDQLLKESGALFHIGGEAQFNLPRNFVLIGQAGFFGGDVDYDGAIQNEDGTLTPTESDTTYEGGELAAKIAHPFALGRATTLTPFAGFGLRAWERTLDASFDDRYIGDHGYIEDWFDFRGILGATIETSLGAKWNGFVTVEIRLPLVTEEVVDLENVGGDDDIDLEPEAKVTGFIEVGASRGMFFASIFAENQNFGESDLDDSGSFLQPESKSTIVGGRAGVTF